MPVELYASASSTPIELYLITPMDVLRTFAVFLVIVAAAVGGTVWVMRPERAAARDLDAIDSVEAAETVPLPRPGDRPRTGGALHVPQYQRAAVDDNTVVIRVGGR